MNKALVLGGGGVAGVAWELGVLESLFVSGVDFDDADLVVGTSVGSVVAAQICSGEALTALCDRQSESGSELKAPGDFADLIDAFIGALAGNPDEDERRFEAAVSALTPLAPEGSVPPDVQERLARIHSPDIPGYLRLLFAHSLARGAVLESDAG